MLWKISMHCAQGTGYNLSLHVTMFSDNHNTLSVQTIVLALHLDCYPRHVCQVSTTADTKCKSPV